MEKKILDTYKNRLINFSGRNQTLCRSKIYSARAFDIVKANKIIPDTAENILLSLIKDSSKEFKLSNRVSDLKLTSAEKKEIKENLNKYLESKIIKDKFSAEEIEKIKTETNKTLKGKAIKSIEKHKLSEKIDYQHSIIKNLDRLFNSIDEKERETGLYELYTGYPFIEGKLIDGKNVRAPLFLFPTQICKRDGEWFYQNLNKEKIYINKVFLMAYKEANEVSIEHIENEYEEVEEFFKECEKISSIQDFLQHCKLWGEQNNFKIDYSNFSDHLELYKDYKKESFDTYENGELHLKNHIILGEHSIGSNGIFKEFEMMLEMDNLPALVRDFLVFDKEITDSDNKSPINKLNLNNIDEKNSFFVTELDYTQEKAVKLAENLENLVIYGPPGTGKSQVIANIVSDYLAKKKRVLLVSEKRTALDVVYKRLETVGLSHKLAFAHDSKKDRAGIMAKIIQNYNLSLEDSSFYSTKIDKMSSEINEKIETLDKLSKELHLTRDMGASLYKLYTSCKVDSDILDDIYSNFSDYDLFDFNSLISMINKFEEIKKHIKFDRENTDISLRKSFADISKIEERRLSLTLEKLNKYFVNHSYSFYKNQLKIIIDNMDFYKFYRDKYQENYELFLIIDDIYSKYNEYEKLFFLSIKKFFMKRELAKNFPDRDISNKKEIIYSLKKERDYYNNIESKMKDSSIDVVEKIKVLINENLLTESKDEALEILETINLLDENIEKLSKHFSFDFIYKIDSADAQSSFDLSALIDTIKKHFRDIRFYDSKKLELDENELKILKHFANNADKSEYLLHLKNSYCFKWIDSIEREVYHSLNIIEEYDSIKEKTLKLIQEKKKSVPDYIENITNSNIRANFQYNRVGNEVFYRTLISEANRKRKKLTLRKYIDTFKNEGLFDLIPCWLLTPEMVSEILPFEKEFFDIVIFDEASQMFVEKSLPSIYRSKKIVVAGDDKQLKPSVIGQKRLEDTGDINNESETDEYVDTSAINVESLLDLAKERYQSTLLNYHYRSRYPELINFSNYAFYKGHLITAPNNQILRRPAIEVMKIDNGIWENQSNYSEAVRVYELVKELLSSIENNESIGIITFNAKQQSLIKDYLDDICEDDEEFRHIYEQEKIRYDDNEDQSLFVKNIENVQGDERDIIIFSTAYARDEKSGKLANRFGTLSQEGGENRLNVAISRAKSKIYIVTSIEAEELNVENSKNNGPKLLKKYLQYARSISDKNDESAKAILESLDKMNESYTIKKDSFDNPFEAELCEKLKENNYIVHTQLGDSAYKINLAIYDEKRSNYILGIEGDGASYYNSPSARDRDIYRQKFLELKGWNIHRVWSKNWWENSQDELNKVIEKIEKFKN